MCGQMITRVASRQPIPDEQCKVVDTVRGGALCSADSYYLEVPMQNAFEVLTVSAIKRESADIGTVIMERPEGSGFGTWMPGQFVSLSLQKDDGWTKQHYFTLSNAPGEAVITVTFRHKGEFTDLLETLDTGAKVRVSGPFGSFCSTIAGQRSVVMIAGGMGITPFLSVLRYYCSKPDIFENAVLIWGNNDPDSFFALPELDAYHFWMNFSAVLVSEHPFQPKHLKKHRITTLQFADGLLSAELLKRHADFKGSEVFVCGSQQMQTYVLEQLQMCGVEQQNIHTEQF